MVGQIGRLAEAKAVAGSTAVEQRNGQYAEPCDVIGAPLKAWARMRGREDWDSPAWKMRRRRGG